MCKGAIRVGGGILKGKRKAKMVGILWMKDTRINKQVRANVYIWGRPPVGVHSISMDQTHYLDCPEESG